MILSALQIVTHLILQQFYKVGHIIIPILQTMKPKHLPKEIQEAIGRYSIMQ